MTSSRAVEPPDQLRRVPIWMLVTLVVCALGAGTVWLVQARKKAELRAPTARLQDNYFLWCSACGQRSDVAADGVAGVPKQEGKLKCPKCGQFAGDWGPPEAQFVNDIARP